MKVLITGANGLLGANAARALAGAGEEVVLFVRPGANMKGVEGLTCEIRTGNILSYADIKEAMHDCDAIIHCASSTDMSVTDLEAYKPINIEATRHVLRALKAHGRKRLVHISTANAFAPGPQERPGTEERPFNISAYNSGYITSKVIAQQMVLDAVKNDHLDAVIANPTFMIGAHDSKPSSGQIILLALKSPIILCPPGGKNFVHVEDVAGAIHKILYYGEKGSCYLLGGENLSYKEFFQLVNDVTERNTPIIPVPQTFLYAAGSFGSIWNYLSSKKTQLNFINTRLLVLDNYYSSQKAQKEFSLSVTPIHHAIADAVGWFTSQKYF